MLKQIMHHSCICLALPNIQVSEHVPMLEAGVCPFFVRILIYVYAHQEANVSWNGSVSSNFTVRNGCGQGKVLAAIAY